MKIFQSIKEWIKLGRQIEKGLYVQFESRETFIATYEQRKVRVYMERLPHNAMIIYHSENDKRAYLSLNDNGLLSEEQYTFVINSIVNHFKKVGYKVEIK
jgi:hypothetical protein